ncbi:MAG: hypothetical protein RL042_1570 [Nitrospirota bacterium]|jgi:hypothetical protein
MRTLAISPLPFQGRCSRPPIYLLVIAATVLILSPTSARSDTTVTFDPLQVRECPQADGSVLYTNKDLPGCTQMTLKPLSVVPSLDNMPIYRPNVATAPHYDVPPRPDRHQPNNMAGGGQAVPDWAKEWHASIAATGSVQAEVCAKYGEWLHLTEKTRGGFFYGTDPSYGGDLSGRNQRGPSYSFYDNARFVTLSRMFGQGFVPIGCP